MKSHWDQVHDLLVQQQLEERKRIVAPEAVDARVREGMKKGPGIFSFGKSSASVRDGWDRSRG